MINLKLKTENSRKGFTLIELMVAMFIFVMIMGAMVAVSFAGFRSYGKSKAIKTVTEDVGFAINSITKDVRMGKIENYYKLGVGSTVPLDGGLKSYLVVSRNRGGKVCYHLETTFLGIQENIGAGNSCSSAATDYKKIVDLAGTGMTFASTSGFYSLATDTTIRGWVEINLNIKDPTMETDSISVQTIVSSRDYGWETP
jgi:prepilin-type N-terminal cleavage/methylation domain-containing protein